MRHAAQPVLNNTPTITPTTNANAFAVELQRCRDNGEPFSSLVMRRGVHFQPTLLCCVFRPRAGTFWSRKNKTLVAWQKHFSLYLCGLRCLRLDHRWPLVLRCTLRPNGASKLRGAYRESRFTVEHSSLAQDLRSSVWRGAQMDSLLNLGVEGKT